MKFVAACGICCDVCILHAKLGCVCSSGIEKVAKEKLKLNGAARAFYV